MLRGDREACPRAAGQGIVEVPLDAKSAGLFLPSWSHRVKQGRAVPAFHGAQKICHTHHHHPWNPHKEGGEQICLTPAFGLGKREIIPH